MQGPRQYYDVFLGWWIRRPVAGATVAILLVLTLIWVPGIWREVPPPPSEQHPREQRPPEQHEQSASGPTRCMLAAERTAFDIRALQSQLMIDALKCGQRDGYNTFIRRHRGDLQAADKQILTFQSDRQLYRPAATRYLCHGPGECPVARGYSPRIFLLPGYKTICFAGVDTTEPRSDIALCHRKDRGRSLRSSALYTRDNSD